MKNLLMPTKGKCQSFATFQKVEIPKNQQVKLKGGDDIIIHEPIDG